jgi:hypothetical protein
MKLPRRELLHLTAGAAALSAVSRIAWAQGYPSRRSTMIVPFGTGGPTDTIGRILAEEATPNSSQREIQILISARRWRSGLSRTFLRCESPELAHSFRHLGPAAAAAIWG